jgi:hypothetical protein
MSKQCKQTLGLPDTCRTTEFHDRKRLSRGHSDIHFFSLKYYTQRTCTCTCVVPAGAIVLLNSLPVLRAPDHRPEYGFAIIHASAEVVRSALAPNYSSSWSQCGKLGSRICHRELVSSEAAIHRVAALPASRGWCAVHRDDHLLYGEHYTSQNPIANR